jgi:WD40 repeat protein
VLEPGVTVESASFTPDGSQLVLGSFSGSMVVVDVGRATIVRTIPVGTPTDQITVAVAPVGDLLAVGDSPVSGQPSTISLWSTASWTTTSTLASFGPIGISHLVISNDGSRLAVGLADGAGSVWSLATHEELAQFLGLTSEIDDASFSADGQRVLLSAWDGSARAYQATGPGLASAQLSSAMSPDFFLWGRTEVSALLESVSNTCTPSCTWATWTWPGGVLTSQRVVASNANDLVAVSGATIAVSSPDATGSNDWTVTVRSLPSFRTIRTLANLPIGPVGTVTNSFVGLTGDGRYLEVALAGKQPLTPLLRTYDVATGAILGSRRFPTPKTLCGIDNAASSQTGSELALADYCGHAWVIALSGQKVITALNAGGRESAMAFNPSGSQLAVATWDGIAAIFDPHTGRSLFQLVGSPEGLSDIAYSPDGRYIVTTAANGDVQTWSSSTGRLLRTQTDPYNPASITFTSSAQFSTFDADNTIRTWDVCTGCQDPNMLLSLARRAAVSPLTVTERAQSAPG